MTRQNAIERHRDALDLLEVYEHGGTVPAVEEARERLRRQVIARRVMQRDRAVLDWLAPHDGPAEQRSLPAWVFGRVMRCAWCSQTPLPDGLPYYTRITGSRVQVVPAPAEQWSGSDGICPAHLQAVRAMQAGLRHDQD